MKIKSRIIIPAAAILSAAASFSCSDDSESPSGGCSCAEGQVCSGAGICYDNPECAACRKGEVCVGGKCYDSGDPCAKCDSAQVCVGGKCYDSGDPCAKCDSAQVCVGGKCYDSGDPCAKCDSAQVCVGGVCFDAADPCAKCDSAQVCVGGVCFDAADPCAQCAEGQLCIDGKCAAPGSCVPECGNDEICVEGACVPCPVMCGNTCCKEGQLCDIYFNSCEDPCGDGRAKCAEMCCDADAVCEADFGCVKPCAENETRCENPNIGVTCCGPDQVCEDMVCKEDCRGGIRCNEICCAVGDVCEDNTCKIACDPAAGTRCGAAQELCCDNASQVCIYDKCLPKGKSCTKSSDCDFDEFCEDSTKLCIRLDDIPAICEVRPEKGKFQPKVQWHWPADLPGGKPSLHPEYDQVMNIPAVINLTDDNGDGKIDENDIPDLIFTSFRGHRYTENTVLRIISGDDGHEIATYPDVIFDLADEPGAAKINGDEYPEIVMRVKKGDKKRTLILNLVPKKDGSGYEFVTAADLDPSSFPRFANLDGGKFPQIVTSSGIIEYDEKDGKGEYRFRCKASFGGGRSGHTVADLDGDGEMEIVGPKIYDKNCSVISDSISYSGTVLADLDQAEDTADGRLAVEQIGLIAGGYGSAGVPLPPPGKIGAFKVFKKDGKFTRELIWTKDMPIDYDYAESHMTKNKYDDGSPFTCSRSFHDSFGTGWDSLTAEERLERSRRKICSTGGGPLVVGDFDGDGKPDIGLVTTWSFVVYAANGDIIWADFTTRDASSMATGASLFDFEGDGIAEILYADEIKLKIYKGPGSGIIDPKFGYCAAELLIDPIPNGSGTLIEYPLVVDVDNDNHSEIIIVSNNYAFGDVTGIRAFEDSGNHWVRTRRIWNQYDYHVTNINEDGTVPKRETQNWSNLKLNNFRQNVQPGGLFNAPNLVAEGVKSDTSLCSAPNPSVTLTAELSNKGALGVRAGVRVNFYVENVNGTGKSAHIGSTTVPQVLLPGGTGSASISWDQNVTIDGQIIRVASPAGIRIAVDEPTGEKLYGDFVECIEDDNQIVTEKIELCRENIN